MEVNGVLPISANPVQEGHAVASANQEGGDAAAFAALLYLILGTPQAGTGSTAAEEVKPDETKASAAEVVPSQKGSGAVSIANGESNDPRAFLANDLFAPPAEVAAAAAGAAPTPMLKELAASGAKFDGVFTDGSTPKSAAVADESDALIGGGRVGPGGVSEINLDPIEALTVEESADGNDLSVLNDEASLIQEPAARTALGVTPEAVETDPQVDPDRAFAKFALAEGNVTRRVSVIINTEEPRTWNVERPAIAESTGQVGARADTPAINSQATPAQDFEKPVPGTSNALQRVHQLGNHSIHAEEDSAKEPAGEISLGIERAGKFQFGKTADGGVAEHDARLGAEADTKTDAPRTGPAQRLSDIAAAVPRADIAAEKFAPAGDPAPASWRSTVNRVVEELASQVKLNKREAVIQLDPPELGKIKIDLRIEGDKLEAHIVAETQESRALIENHLQELRQALRSQHLDLVDVRVSQDTGSGGSGDPMQGFRQQQPDGEPQFAQRSENPAAAASATSERSEGGDSLREKGRVSMWA